MAVHNLTNDIALISRHRKGNSGPWPILAGNIRRITNRLTSEMVKRESIHRENDFRLANIQEMSTSEISAALNLEGIKRHPKQLPSKGGRPRARN